MRITTLIREATSALHRLTGSIEDTAALAAVSLLFTTPSGQGDKVTFPAYVLDRRVSLPRADDEPPAT
jgi:hypothetical protein